MVYNHLPAFFDDCVNAPTPTLGSVTDVLNTCASTGWDVTVPWTGMTFGAFELEVWRKSWEGAASEPGSHSFWIRVTSGSNVHELDTLFGSDVRPVSETRRRKYQLRVVPKDAANGAGPFCFTGTESSQLNRFGYLCLS